MAADAAKRCRPVFPAHPRSTIAARGASRPPCPTACSAASNGRPGHATGRPRPPPASGSPARAARCAGCSACESVLETASRRPCSERVPVMITSTSSCVGGGEHRLPDRGAQLRRVRARMRARRAAACSTAAATVARAAASASTSAAADLLAHERREHGVAGDDALDRLPDVEHVRVRAREQRRGHADGVHGLRRAVVAEQDGARLVGHCNLVSLISGPESRHVT